MQTLTFRAATVADVDDVVALVESAYRGAASREGWTTEADLLDGRRTDAAEVTGLVTGGDGRIVLAESAGEPPQLVGCCHLRLVPGEPAYFGMFAVRPGMQGSGTGRALLGEVEAQALSAGADRMRMTIIAQRHDLIAWYERLGYRATGETLPWPDDGTRNGIPKVPGLVFVWYEKVLG